MTPRNHQKLITTAIAIASASLLALASCRSPVLQTSEKGASLTLRFLVGDAQVQSGAKLLLGTASILRVTMVPTDGLPSDLAPVEAAVPSGGGAVDVAFGTVRNGSFTITAEAKDSVGTVLFQQSAAVAVQGTGVQAITLALVPANPSGLPQLSSGTSTGSLSLPAGKSISYILPAAAMNDRSFILGLLSGTDTAIRCYVQDEDGTSLSSEAGDRVFVAQAKASHYAFATLYNPDSTNHDYVLKALPNYSAAWARTTSSGSDVSVFYGVGAISGDGAYAVGAQTGTGDYYYGTQKATGTAAGTNAVIVKYSARGEALWAACPDEGGTLSTFNNAAADNSGNVYVAGTTASAALLVKYDASGNELWRRHSTGAAVFQAVAVSSDGGSVYAVGSIPDTASYTFGDLAPIAGRCPGGNNLVIVKYDAAGNAVWARTLTQGGTVSAHGSYFSSVAADASGAVYAAGYIGYPDTWGFGNSVAAQTPDGVSAANAVLVKYSPEGDAQWARVRDDAIDGATGWGLYSAVAVDSAGSVYAAGDQSAGTYTYGAHATTQTASNYGMMIVKYDSGGNASWAKTMTAGSADLISSLAVDGNDNVYAAGYATGTGTVDAGNSVTAAGPYTGTNIFAVSFDSAGNARWARSAETGAAASSGSGIGVDAAGNAYLCGSQTGTTSFVYGELANAAGIAAGTNSVLVMYGK